MKVFIIAGEASGDVLGASFIKELKQDYPDVEIKGVGGHLMEKEGLTSNFPMTDLSVMGVFEVFPKLPLLLKRISETVKSIIKFNPDVVLTIDAQDFCSRVVKRAKKKCIKTKFVHYVAPTVWAWRPGRAKKVAKIYDSLLCLFPFEPDYFEKEGLNAHFVGHPFIQSKIYKEEPDIAAFKSKYKIKNDDEILGVFFGSRLGEISRTGKVLENAAIKWQQEKKKKVIVITLPHLKDCVPNHKDWVVVSEDDDKAAAFRSLDKAMAVSGTIGLELSVLNIPHLIAYKANPITAFFIRRMIKTKFVHLSNILLGKQIIPEFLQERCNYKNVLNTLNGIDVHAQKKASKDIRDLLESDLTPVQAAFLDLPR